MQLRQGLQVTVLSESFLLRKPQSLLSEPSPDCTRPTHVMEGDQFYSKSSDFRVDRIYKISSQQFDQTKLGTVTHSQVPLRHNSAVPQ